MLSPEDVESVRQTFEAFNRRDVPALLERLDPAIEWIPLRSLLEGTTYHGHDGVRQNLAETFTDWEWVQLFAEEFRATDDGILVRGRLTGRATDGPTTSMPAAWRIRLVNGRVVGFKTCSRQEILEISCLAFAPAPVGSEKRSVQA